MFARNLKRYQASLRSVCNSNSFATLITAPPAQLFHLYQPCTDKTLTHPPNLIVLHGVLGSCKNFRGITHNPKIASKVDTYLLDMRNHGKSEHRESMSYPEMAEDVHNFMVEHKLDNAPNVLLGHSMGSRIAMELAVHCPYLVRGVIIEDLAPYNYREDKNFNFIETMDTMIEKLTHVNLNQDLHKIRDEIFVATMDREVAEVIATNVVPDGHGGYMWRINIHAIDNNLRKQILNTEYNGHDKYYGPVRVIFGNQSDYTSPHIVSSFHNIFPNLDLQNDVFFVNDSGHWVHYSKPYEFIDLVSEFLDQVLDHQHF